MEIYRIKNRGNMPDTYISKDCTSINNQGRLKYFAIGKGFKTTSQFELIDLYIDESRKDALYIGEIADKYGHDIAVEACEIIFGCCRISAKSRAAMFLFAYQTAKNNLTESEINQVSRVVVNLFRVFYIFPILDLEFLDRRLSELDSDYDCANCTYQGQANVSLEAYITIKFGHPTTKLIEKMIELGQY